MVKIVYAPLKNDKSDNGRRRSGSRAKVKVVTAPDGSRQTFAMVDADSPTFSDDLTAAFQRNVSRARRENKRLIGVSDGGAT